MQKKQKNKKLFELQRKCLTTEDIKELIKNFDIEQIIFFAWLCAFRVLPFVGGKGNFEFWKKKNEVYLMNLFAALDGTYIMFADAVAARVDAAVVYTADNIAAEAEAAYAAGNAAAYASPAAEAEAYAAYATYASYAAAEAAVAYAEAASAYAEAASSALYHIDVEAVIDAAEAAVDAAADAAAYAADAVSYAAVATSKSTITKKKIEIFNYNIILEEDILLISEKNYDALNNSIAIYGNILDKFISALKEIGCEYWGDLYLQIYASHFQQDKQVVARRLSIPKEIKELGAKEAALYLMKIEQEGAERLNEARIILLGDKGAGKTCLARRLIKPDAPMTKLEESTPGVEKSVWSLEENKERPGMRIHIWDFAGHVITHAAHRCFLSERCVYIILYNGRVEERNNLSYWLDHVKNYGGNAQVYIVANLMDENLPSIPINNLRNEYPFPIKIHSFSIQDDKDTLEEFREEIKEYIRNNPSWNREEIPIGYYRVKEALEHTFDRENEQELITYGEFNSIAMENGIKEDELPSILKSLHALGICMWYHDLLGFDTLVLNPEWITNGIYKIINWGHNHEKYMITNNDYMEIFKEDKERYPADKISYIYRLMEKYELAFSKNNGTYESSGFQGICIPLLMKDDRPDDKDIPDFENGLMIQYVSDGALPPNTITRLIVKHHKEIRKEADIWKFGAILFQNDDTIALAEERDRKIVIKVKGSNESCYIAMLKETMKDIFESYKSRRPELLYKVIDDSSGKMTEEPLMLAEQIIRGHLSNGKDCYYDSINNRNISLSPTADKYQIITIQPNYFIGCTVENAAVGTSPTAIQYNFNYKDCNINIQGGLHSLIDSIPECNEELIKQMKSIIQVMELSESNSKEEIKRKGLLNKLRYFLEDLGNKDSKNRRIIEGVEYGVKAIQDLGEKYNEIAEWAGLKKIPKILL